MLPVSKEQFARAAHDVHVLWDEAQTNPALLRFLAPFSRPDLGRLARLFLSASSVEDIVTEAHPANATWLATLLARELREVPPMKVRALEQPRWDTRLLMPGMHFTEPVLLSSELSDAHTGDTSGRSQLRSLIIAGSMRAPSVVVRASCLVVAGDLDTQVLVADGCVLVGGTVRADVVVNPSTRIGGSERGRAVGWQVGHSVVCRVFDSPRFALTCPVKADVVLRAVGQPATPDGIERAAALLEPGLLAPPSVAVSALLERVRRGQSLLRG
ncbi:MAG: hypothetical protein QM817_37365 [Archangium sp.]